MQGISNRKTPVCGSIEGSSVLVGAVYIPQMRNDERTSSDNAGCFPK